MSGRCCCTTTMSRDLSLLRDLGFHLNCRWVTNHRPKHVVFELCSRYWDKNCLLHCQVRRWVLPQVQLTSFSPYLGNSNKCLHFDRVNPGIVLFLVIYPFLCKWTPVCRKCLPAKRLSVAAVLLVLCNILLFFLSCLSHLHKGKLPSSAL